MNVRNHLLMKNANIVIHHGESTFPTTPALGTMAMVDGVLYVYSTINGLDTWTPLTNRTLHATHIQSVANTTWTINHGLGTKDLIFFVYDDTDTRNEPSDITFTSVNTLTLSFSSAITGRAIVFAAVDEIGITISNMFDKTGNDIIFKGNLIPDSDSTWSIGNTTSKLKELYVSANSIHVGDTLFSGSNITMAAGSTISADAIGTTGNVTVGGDLTVNGAMTTVSSTNLEISDNVIIVNQGEVGSGVTAGSAGIRVDRGGLTDAMLLFDETTDAWKAGEEGSEINLSFEGHGHAVSDVSGLQAALDAATHELPIWVEKANADDGYVLSNGDNIACNTTGGAFAVILPSNPQPNWSVRIVDAYGHFNTANLTVQRAGTGENIMGAIDNLILDVDNYSTTLTYLNASRGWILT